MTAAPVDRLPGVTVDDPRAQLVLLLYLGLLLAGTSLALVAVRRPRLDVLATGAASAGAGGWLLANAAAEGPTLVVLRPGNGLTLADLAAAPAVLLVAWLALRRWRGRDDAEGEG